MNNNKKIINTIRNLTRENGTKKRYYIGIGLFFLVIFFTGCAFQINNTEEQETFIQKRGTVFGNIGIYQGNCMPDPGRAPCSPKGLKTTVFITKPANKYSSDLLVSSAKTDENGYFESELEPGDYSLFIYDNLSGSNSDLYVCDRWSCPPGKECACMPFTIVAGERIRVDANINRAVW
ncbi:MAG: hypothetical protein PHG59_03290 [Patescibacteria group bacterium]|jgi:hypothetical protein|nr:hypothetical protein [Patescibacteria group bacterium]